MVRGLVEHEQVGLHHEQAGEMRAHDPAAAHLLRGAQKVRLLIAEPAQHFLRARLHLRIAQRLVLRVRFHVFRAIDRAGLFQFVQPRFERLHVARAARGHVEHGHFADRFALLRQVADHRPLIALDGPGVRVLGLQDDGEERGFPRAIRPDERDAFAVVDLHRGVFKERATAVAFLEVADGEHGKMRWPGVSGALLLAVFGLWRSREFVKAAFAWSDPADLARLIGRSVV